MNRKQISALLVLRELGIEQKLNTFSERLAVQKGVYLAQAAGIDLGHYFSWYLRGPYSRNLTQDVFEAIQNYDAHAIATGWELDKKTREKLTKLRRTLAPAPDLSLEQPAWLELLASVHFLIDRHQARRDPAALTSQLKKFHKDFTRTQVAAALQKLRNAGVLTAH